MVKFDTRLKLMTYLGKTGPKEGKYIVLQDETMQNKKAVYSFVNGELIVESGGTRTINWRTTVATYALVAGITTPVGLDAVIVNADETHNGNKTWYLYDGYAWNYKGAYQKRETDYFLSPKDTRGTIVNQLVLDFDYIVGNGELDIYLDGVLANQYLTEFGDAGFSSKTVKFKIDIPISTDIEVKKSVPNIDDEPRTNDEVYVAAFKHNYTDIEKYIRYEKSVVIGYDTFADVQNDILLVKENQVIRTFGHVTKNDGKGRYWILEATDKDFAYKNKAGSLFINRLIGADEVQVGHLYPLMGGDNAPPETVAPLGQIANRADYKRIWAWAVAGGKVVTEANWAAYPGCFSSGDGSTTFRFPKQADFVRGWDGVTSTGTYQDDAIQTHRHTTGTDGSTIETPASGYNVKGVTVNGIAYGSSNQSGTTGMNSTTTSVPLPSTSGGTVNISTETRPKNIMRKFFIKI